MAKVHQSPLMRIIQVASELGVATVADEAFELADRVAEGRFFCACVGQFKRGKSTLVNALIGEAVLPVGVVPVTSTITVIKYSKQRGARVRFTDGNSKEIQVSELHEYVSEENNPENVRGVVGVEVFLPSPLLMRGLCLVDTPGIGSVFAWNTAVTRAFVPQVDAALVVLGADPPISRDELALVEQVAQQTSTLIFVLNKADRLTSNEREEASRFTKQVLSKRLHLPSISLYQVSATEKLYGDQATRDWEDLEADLGALALGGQSELVASAEARGLERLVKRLTQEIDARHDALTRPLDESRGRLEALRRSVEEAVRSMEDLVDLSTADQSRVARELRERREAFLAGATVGARDELLAEVRASPHKGAPLRAVAVDAAQRIARMHLETCAAELQTLAEQRCRETMERLARHTDDFIERVASSGLSSMKSLHRPVDPTEGFKIRAEVSEADMPPPQSASAVKLAGEVLRSHEVAVRATSEEIGLYLDQLLEANSARIVSQIKEWVVEVHGRLQVDARKRLRDIVGMAERALERATQQHEGGSEKVASELERLARLRNELQSLAGERRPA